jgi:ribosomal protein S18 acetylase RimI-like enzyme
MARYHGKLQQEKLHMSEKVGIKASPRGLDGNLLGPLLVKILERDNLEAFYKLRMKAITEEPNFFGADISRWRTLSLEEVEATISTPEGSFALGAFDRELCGFLCFSVKSPECCSHKGILWGMYVSPHHRGSGIGSLLLKELKAICKSRGILSVNLIVFGNNQAAISLYLKNGFSQFGVERQASKIGDNFVDENWLECWL